MAKPTKPTNKNSNKNKKGAGCSLANIWEVTDPTEASNNLTLGEQQARLADIKVNNNPEKGLAVFLKWEGLAEENTEGLSSSQMYRVSDSTGAKAAGAAYLMRDLGILGYPDIKPAKIEAKLKEIAEEGIVALVNVKQSGEYVNVYVQGLPVDADVDPDDADEEAEEEAEEEEEEEESPELEVGDEVTWSDEDGDEQSGTISKIKGELAILKDSDGTTHKVDLSDLSKAEEAEEAEEEEEEDATIEVGSKVKWADEDGDEKEGEITKIKGDLYYIEDADGDVIKIDSTETEVELAD